MNQVESITIDELKKNLYDYIVIGTGIGGGTIGLSLAKKGKKVLFIDRGLLKKSVQPVGFPEEHLPLRANLDFHDELLKKFGRCTQKVTDISYGKNTEFIPLLGEGAGGSSSLYGAAFERFFPDDFKLKTFYDKTSNLKNSLDQSNIVDWPIQYSDLESYYSDAEAMYSVVGQRDPLRLEHSSLSELSQSPLTELGEIIFSSLKNKKLHPYRLPVAHVDWSKASCPGCQGTLCEKHEKKDSFNSAIYEAMDKYGADFLELADVQFFDASRDEVNYVTVKVGDKSYNIEGKKFILAAGAIFTPAILLKSKSLKWPKGLGNNNDLVGRYLCRHYMDLITLKNIPKKFLLNKIEKEIALNDFYICSEGKFGTVQSLGNNPTGKAVITELIAELKSERNWIRKFFLGLVTQMPFADKIADYVVSGLNMALIMEDHPSFENRVFLNENDQVLLRYEMQSESKKRLNLFRQKALKAFAEFSPVLQAQGENNQRLAHASGTCRMGIDVENSVVDRNNQVHGVKNLYIVDSSFLPTSAGINPSLTIAANALRVADILEK